jgi:hypothetical protein
MSTDIDISPWIQRVRIYKRDSVSVIQTSIPQWVVKYASSPADIATETEFLMMLQHTDRPLRNMIELPADPTLRFGKNWYAMRRYTGSVYSCWREVRGRWATIAIAVLNFLEDLHRGYGILHLDITLANILFHRESGHFVVSDYELLAPVSEYGAVNDDRLWYYIGAGADPSAPLESWRMDLTMLGYAIDDLTRSRAATFIGQCQQRRAGDKTISDDDILARRDADMASCHPTVRTYLDRVASLVSWHDTDPPSTAVYDQLRAIFSDSGASK